MQRYLYLALNVQRFLAYAKLVLLPLSESLLRNGDFQIPVVACSPGKGKDVIKFRPEAECSVCVLMSCFLSAVTKKTDGD